jgi:lipopolysaccharide/colanic/teichoic acid biosynthesis glycosyltransferase
MSRYVDVTISAVVLLVVSPVLLVLTAVGAFTTGEPIVYGKAGQEFSANNKKELLAQE